MEKLIYTDLKISSRRAQIAKEGALSLTAGVISVLCFISIFDISFDIGNWYKGGIVSGLACFWNKISNFLLINEGLILKEVAGAADDCQLFMVMLMVAMTLITWFIIKSGNPYLVLIYPALIGLPQLITEQEPNVVLLALLIGCMFAIYLEMMTDGGISKWQFLLPATLIVVLLAGMSSSVTSEWFERANTIDKIDEKIETKIENIYYGENLLKDGQVTAEAREKATGKTALEVEMQKNESTYLRGFVGEMYSSEGQWTSLPNGVYSETKNLFYWLDEEGFNASGQIGQVNDLIEEKKKENKITVSAKNADSKYAYIPYELESFLEEEGIISWYGSSYSDGNFGTLKEYSYTSAENSVKRWTDVTGKFFTTERDESITAYLEMESYYNEFAYQYYTYVPDKEKEILSEYFGDPGNQTDGHIEYKTAITKVSEYLDENIIYTETPGLDRSEKATVLEAFLSEGKGYDVHYATAAALMFRYYGIPARYVEGYLITPDNVKNTADGQTMAIPDGNIHAWAEIYVDGIGWVPIEISPEYEGVMEAADMAIGLSNDSLKQKFEETNQTFQMLQEMESGTGEEDINPMLKIVISILLLLIILLILIIAAIKAIRKVKQLKQRRKAFYMGPAKTAVSAVYDYMNKLELDIHDEARMLGNKASYSRQDVSEEERQTMLRYLKELKVEKRENERKKRKIRNAR